MLIIEDSYSRSKSERRKVILHDAPLSSMKEVSLAANGGVIIKLTRTDEFGYWVNTEISLDPSDLMIIKATQLFNDPLL